MAKKTPAEKLANRFIGITAFLVLLLAGLKAVFGWDWGNTFMSFIVMAVSIGLVVGSGISLNNIIRKVSSLKPIALFNVFVFGLGLVGFYIGLIMLPMLGALSIPALANLSGWVLLLEGAVALFKVFT